MELNDECSVSPPQPAHSGVLHCIFIYLSLFLSVQSWINQTLALPKNPLLPFVIVSLELQGRKKTVNTPGTCVFFCYNGQIQSNTPPPPPPHTHTHTHIHTLVFIVYGDSLHRRFIQYKPYFLSPYYNPGHKPTPYMKLCTFLLSQKTHSVIFISLLNYGDTEIVLINHLLLVIPMSYPCHYTNLCPHKPHT